MFTKKKLIAFLAACAVFLAIDLWMFSVLRGSYEKTVLQDKKELIVALARSAPAEAEKVVSWLEEARKAYPGLRLLHIQGIPGVEDVQIASQDAELKNLWSARQGEAAFKTGIEAASYLEVFVVPDSVRLGQSKSLLMFAPVPNKEGDTAVGIVVAAVDEAVLTSFVYLTYALSAIAFLVFALGFGIASFSRDPLTGYAILVLFAIVLTFVAYPLFEALRLTFVKEGRFSFAIWKDILTNRQYLGALAGSVQLGALTATLSTIIGFLFAFFVARTSMWGKKLVTALATLPVISPPFSLTLSIILLFGNNGLITKRLMGLEHFSIYGLGGLGLVQTISMFPIAFLTMAGCFVKNWGIDYTFTTANIVEALQRGKAAMISTVTLAGIATPIAGFIAMIGAVLVVRKRFPGKRMLEAMMMTPFAVPGTLIGISYILAFNKPPLLLVGTGAILVICYVIRELPVGLEGGVATLRQIDPSIEEAASDLGADQATVFRTVILPLIRPAFISSMSYTFVRSMTAVSAIIFLISARWYHITIQIYNFSENIRFGLASVLATALIIIVLAVFGLMRVLVKKSEHLEKTVTVQ